MKVMCVIGAFSYGGAERVMTNIVNHICNRHGVIYVAIGHREEIPYPINDKVKIYNGISTTKMGALFKLRKIIHTEKPDIILSFLTQINILSIAAAIGTGSKIIVSERNDPSQNVGIIKKTLRVVAYQFADGFVFQTDTARKYFNSRIQRKSIVIPNPVFINKEDFEYRRTNERHEIIAAGRLERQKNHKMLIDAFEMIMDDFPDYKLKIYGDGSLRSWLSDYIVEKHLRDRVCLCGQSNELHKLIRDAVLFVLPSDFEGMPNALMEAMALGLCCISTDCPAGGSREIISDGENGFLVPVNNPLLLAEKMKYLLQHPRIREQVSLKAKKIYQIYGTELISRRWEQYMIDICNLG